MTGQKSANRTEQSAHARVRIAFGFALFVLALAAPADGASPVVPPNSISRAVAPPLPPPPGDSRFRPDQRMPLRPGEPPVPSVAIHVRVPAEAAVGRELVYRITAENCSRAAAHHVTVRVPLPSGSRFVRANPAPAEDTPVLTWKLGTLAPCVKREITLVVIPDGISDLSCCARVQFEHGQCVRTRLRRTTRPPSAPPAPPARPAPAGAAVLRLRMDGPRQAARYDILSFKLLVTNTGRGPARNVVVESTLPKGLDFLNSKPSTTGDNPLVWKLGTLPAGASRSVEFQAVAKETGTLTSKGIVRAEGGLAREGSWAVRIGQPALSVVKSGPKQRLVGRPATFVITVSNPGTLPATNVQLTDELPQLDEEKKPSGLVFISATEGGRLDGSHVRWNVGTLVAGEKRIVQMTMRATRAGRFENVCTATGDRGLTEQGRAETRFETGAVLAVEIDRDRQTARVGEEATFTVRIFNGSKAAETNLAVVATLPEGLKLIEIKGPTGSTTAGQKIRFPVVASLPAGGERLATIRVRGLEAGVQTLQVEAVSDSTGPDKPITGEETLTVTEAKPGKETSRRDRPRATIKAAS